MLGFLREKFLSFFHARAENCFFCNQSFSCLECMSLLWRQARLALASVKAVCSIAQCLLSCHVGTFAKAWGFGEFRCFCLTLFAATSSAQRGEANPSHVFPLRNTAAKRDFPGFSRFFTEGLWQTQEQCVWHSFCLQMLAQDCLFVMIFHPNGWKPSNDATDPNSLDIKRAKQRSAA